MTGVAIEQMLELCWHMRVLRPRPLTSSMTCSAPNSAGLPGCARKPRPASICLAKSLLGFVFSFSVAFGRRAWKRPCCHVQLCSFRRCLRETVLVADLR